MPCTFPAFWIPGIPNTMIFHLSGHPGTNQGRADTATRPTRTRGPSNPASKYKKWTNYDRKWLPVFVIVLKWIFLIVRFRFWMIQDHLLMTSRDNGRKFQFVKQVIQEDSSEISSYHIWYIPIIYWSLFDFIIVGDYTLTTKWPSSKSTTYLNENFVWYKGAPLQSFRIVRATSAW